jgi:hypothetical protein
MYVSRSAQAHFGAACYKLWVLLGTLWACNRHRPSIHYMPKMCINDPKSTIGSTKSFWRQSIFFEIKMDLAKGRQGKKEADSTFVLLAIRTLCCFNIFCVINDARTLKICEIRVKFVDCNTRPVFLGFR